MNGDVSYAVFWQELNDGWHYEGLHIHDDALSLVFELKTRSKCINIEVVTLPGCRRAYFWECDHMTDNTEPVKG